MASEDLDAIAAAELIKEAKRGSERAKDIGAMGWRKCPLPTANKVFLNNTLLSIIGHSKRHQRNREQNLKAPSVSKNSSSFERDRRKRAYSPHSHPEQKISRTDRDNKERNSLFERKHSYSSHCPSSYREERESKHKKKKIK